MKENSTFYLSLFFGAFFALILAIISGLYFDPVKILHQYSDNEEVTACIDSRIYKPYWADQSEREIYFLGSSRTYWGVNPDHIEHNFGIKVFNLGLPGANLHETLSHLKVIHHKETLRHVFIILDFSMFDKNNLNLPNFSEDRIQYLSKKEREPIYIQEWKKVFSIDTLIKYISQDINCVNQKVNGSLNWSSNHTAKLLYERVIDIYSKYLVSDFQYSESGLNSIEEFSTLTEVAQSHPSTQFHIVFSPFHSSLYEIFFKFKKEELLKKVRVDTIKAVQNYSNIKVWDYMNFIRSTKPYSSIVDSRSSLFHEPSHFSFNYGNILFKEIIDNSPNVGTIISSSNIESHFSKIKRDRKKWIQSQSYQVWPSPYLDKILK